LAENAPASPLPIASRPLAAFAQRQPVCQALAAKSGFLHNIVVQTLCCERVTDSELMHHRAPCDARWLRAEAR